MLETLASSVGMLSDTLVLWAALSGVCLGLFFGVLPGLSGLTALAMLLPFIYGMEPMVGLGFLLSAHAAVYTGGSVTAILLGIPGAPANAATVADGYAMQRCGLGTYAVGAALTASALGGLLGALMLAVLLPLLQPVVLAFGAPETLLLALIGITYVAVLGKGEPYKGLAAAGLGVFLATFGYQQITGVPRFWMESDYLLDGIRLVPLVLGLFAIPEIVDLLGKAETTSPAQRIRIDWRDFSRGTAAVLKRPWLFLRSTLIGVFVGIVPGVGGETAPYLAYAARGGGKASEGAGRITGVIAPESCNNAKEGGALVPTLALGVPGSAGMSLLLGAFLVLGMDPGPDFLDLHLDLAIGLALLLALTNVLSALCMVPLSVVVANMTRIRGRLLAPLLLVLVVLGAYFSGKMLQDVVAVFLFGALGIAMKRLDYSRPALLLGFILGPVIETYLHISLQAYGFQFILRPITLTLALLLAGGLLWTFFGGRIKTRS